MCCAVGIAEPLTASSFSRQFHLTFVVLEQRSGRMQMTPQDAVFSLQLVWSTVQLQLSTSSVALCRDRYKAIGGGSPLRRITEEQGDALAQALRRKGQEASVYVAMRYWKPFTEDAIELVRLAPLQ